MSFRIAKCRSCGAPVIWALTVKGNATCFDAQPNTEGTFVLRRGKRTATIYTKYVKTDDEEYAGEPRYTSHFASCPNADQHRKDRT